MHAIRSDEGQTLETSPFLRLFTVANLRYQFYGPHIRAFHIKQQALTQGKRRGEHH